MRPGALEQRIKDQDETLESALRFVKRGGRIVYITCSVLRAENEERIAAFMPATTTSCRLTRMRRRPPPACRLCRASFDAWPRLPPEPENDGNGRVLYRDAGADVRRRPLPPQIAFWVDSVLVSGPWSY